MRSPHATLVVAAVLLLAGCGGTSGSPSGATAGPAEGSVTPSGVPSQESVAPAGDPKCLAVHQSTIDAITAGLEGVTVEHAAAYRSDDHEQVWYVSVELVGDDMEPGEHVATFGTDHDPSKPGTEGLTFAVGDSAHEFSDLGHGEDHETELHTSDHGVDESQACLAQ